MNTDTLTESQYTEAMDTRQRLREVVRGLSTGGHRSNGDAADFARRHGLNQLVGKR